MPKRKKPAIPRPVPLSPGLERALRRAYPHGCIEVDVPLDETYLADLAPKLREKLARIPGAILKYEHPPEPERSFSYRDRDDDFDDPPLDDEPNRSYHLFFVHPRGEPFEYECEEEALNADEGEEAAQGELTLVHGDGVIGCVVAVSAVARFARLRLGAFEQFENGDQSLPDIHSAWQNEAGERIEPDAYYRDQLGEAAFAVLAGLREQILTLLKRHKLTVISDSDASAIVPWLRPGNDVLLGDTVTVAEALFFWLA